MARKSENRRKNALAEIGVLDVKRKHAMLKMIAVTVATAVVILIIQYMALNGYLGISESMRSTVTMVIVCAMAIFDGLATKNYTKNRDEIKAVQQRVGLTDQEVKDYLHS